MNQPEPQAVPFSVMIADIEKGLTKIPQFQRDFVWTKEKSARLLDSILKGYPIGTFILWKTKESLRSVRNIGGAALPDTPDGDYVQYVLDGQQRITSLFASLKGLTIKRQDRIDDFGQMHVNLQATPEEPVDIMDVSDKPPHSTVKLVDLIQGDLEFLAAFPKPLHKKIQGYKEALTSCAFSVILVKDAPLDVATEIFTRINVTGQPLSVFEIMVAKTFDARWNFDLAEQYGELITDLQSVNYETVPAAVVLQAVSAVMVSECSKKQILLLDKNKFIDTWPAVVDALKAAVDYFRSYYRIPVSQLLPYASLLVPFSYFFFHHPDKPTGETQKLLSDFFWRCSLGGRYSTSAESRLAQDLGRVDDILAGKPPKYDYGIDTSGKFVLENGWFSAGRSYIKAILCILAYKQPKSFIHDSVVNISNDWLKQANSKNYHHFFPKAYLERNKIDYRRANHIGNITIVDAFLNKRKIRDKAPSEYMLRFKKDNPNLMATMRTHLIDLDKCGVWEDDYEKFLFWRCMAIAEEMKKRIIPRDIDSHGQHVQTDDFEEGEVESGE